MIITEKPLNTALQLRLHNPTMQVKNYVGRQKKAKAWRKEECGSYATNAAKRLKCETLRYAGTYVSSPDTSRGSGSS